MIQYFPACARVHSSHAAPKISVSGNLRTGSSLLTVDEPLHVTIGGLESRQRVTLRATLKLGGRNETTFQSFAHYEADSFGHVDLKEHVSQGGTYQGAEPMGLFWSMKPLKNDGITQSRFMPKDVNSPIRSHFELYDGFVNFGLKKYSDVVELGQTLHPIESKTIDRWYLDNERVARETVKTGRLRGEIFIPKSPGKFKGDCLLNIVRRENCCVFSLFCFQLYKDCCLKIRLLIVDNINNNIQIFKQDKHFYC